MVSVVEVTQGCAARHRIMSSLLLLASLPALLPQTGIVQHVTNVPWQNGRSSRICMATDAQRSWPQRLKSGGATLAAAALLATPRGHARAAELEPTAPITVTRDVEAASNKRPLAFVGIRRRQPLDSVRQERFEQQKNEINMDKIVDRKMAKRFTERDYIFSDSLTAKSELQEELDELDAFKEANRGQMMAQTAITTGGAVGLVWVTVQSLLGIERWMKKQELKAIEEEIETTGQCACAGTLTHPRCPTSVASECHACWVHLAECGYSSPAPSHL